MDDWISKSGLAAIDPPRLRELSRRSDAKGAIQLATHVGAALVSGSALYLLWGTWWAVPLFIVHGVIVNFFYAGQHEFSHWTVFKTKAYNEIAGETIGFFMFYPAKWDRWFHFAHHRHTQDWDKDAELLVRGPYTLGSYLMALSGIRYWYGRWRSILRMSLGLVPPYAHWLNDEQKRAVIAEARWHVAGYAAIATLSVVFQSWIAVMLWLAPMLATKIVHQLQNVGEHTGLTHYPDTLRNTRTLKGPFWLRFLAWNMSYHTVHHTFPGVPFHALPELHREIEKRLGHELPTQGYIACHIGIFKSLWRGKEQVAPATTG